MNLLIKSVKFQFNRENKSKKFKTNCIITKNRFRPIKVIISFCKKLK